MPGPLAVAVVLLPPPEIMEEIIALIANLPASSTKLNMHDTLPHLTVAMGLLKSSQVEQASKLLHELVAKRDLPTVTISRSNNYKTPDNKQFSDLRAELSAELVEFHTTTMQAFQPILTYKGVSPTMFVSPPLWPKPARIGYSTTVKSGYLKTFTLTLPLVRGLLNRLLNRYSLFLTD